VGILTGIYSVNILCL